MNRRNAALRQAVEKLRPQPQQLLVVWGPSCPWTAIRPFESPDYLHHRRTFTLGTGQRTPDAAKILSEYGIEDLHIDLGRRRDLFFIRPLGSKYYRIYSKFIKQHYGLWVEWDDPWRRRMIPIIEIEIAGPTQDMAETE